MLRLYIRNSQLRLRFLEEFQQKERAKIVTDGSFLAVIRSLLFLSFPFTRSPAAFAQVETVVAVQPRINPTSFALSPRRARDAMLRVIPRPHYADNSHSGTHTEVYGAFRRGALHPAGANAVVTNADDHRIARRATYLDARTRITSCHCGVRLFLSTET